MKSDRWFLGGLALIVLLVIGSLMLVLGQQDTEADPSSYSTGPSGTAAFAELLERRGYRVIRSSARIPDLKDVDAVVWFVPSYSNAPGAWEALTSPTETDPDSSSDSAPSSSDELRIKAYSSFVESGGRIVEFAVPRDYSAASAEALGEALKVVPRYRSEVRAIVVTGRTADVDGTGTFEPCLYGVEGLGCVASLTAVGNGSVIASTLGLALTNRFLAEDENAEFGLDMMALAAPPGSTVLLDETVHRPPSVSSLAEALGPWAIALRNQALFVFVVVVITLGKRFGIPIKERGKQRGARELLDALHNVMARGDHGAIAIKWILDRRMREVRRATGLALDADSETRVRALGEKGARAVVTAQASSELRVSGDRAVKVVSQLEDALAPYTRRIPYRRRRRR